MADDEPRTVAALLRWFSRLGALVVAVIACGCSPTTVVRVVDGQFVEGRFLHPEAYAAFARGAVAEADARPRTAKHHYRTAARLDPKSVTIWARLGGVHCTLQQMALAERAFTRALKYAGARQDIAFAARARCRLRRGQVSLALADARRALMKRPEKTSYVELFIEVAGRAERSGESESFRRELQVTSPPVRRKFSASSESMKGDGDLARALRRGDVDEARRIEKRRRISTLRFGIQAFLEGRPDIAVTSACRRLRADPDDSDHRVLCALAADLAGQHEVFDEAWRRAPGMPRPLGPLGRLMLVELLFRHGGLDAARPGIAALSSVRRQVTEDPLARALLVRVLPGEPARRGKRR